jgi:hypothetical protein
MALTHYQVEVRLANEKPVQTEVFADTNGSNNSGNSKLLKAVEEKINTIMPKKVKILGVKILKIVK